MLVAVLEIIPEGSLEEVIFLSDIRYCLLDVLEGQLRDVGIVDEDRS